MTPPTENFEELAQKAEDELLDPNIPEARAALINVRLFRKWYSSEWTAHKEMEEKFQQSIKRWVWGLRIGASIMGVLGALIVWALATISQVIALINALGRFPAPPP